jgi:hypothetical protein
MMDKKIVRRRGEGRMNLRILKPGHKVTMSNGAEAKILAETEDGDRIKVEYVESADDAPPGGAEQLVDGQEVEALIGIAHTTTWGEEVTVIVHHIPESEDSEDGFEAVTMKGVPYGVSISGYDSDRAEDALDQLLDGLRTFGFAGRVIVEDATEPGPSMRYEIQVRR